MLQTSWTWSALLMSEDVIRPVIARKEADL